MVMFGYAFSGLSVFTDRWAFFVEIWMLCYSSRKWICAFVEWDEQASYHITERMTEYE